MGQVYVTAEESAKIISNWCFRKTVESTADDSQILEEREELERQQRLLEHEREEFLREKNFEEQRLKQEKRLFDMKWKMLEEEWRKLVAERERVERRKSFYARMEDFEAKERIRMTSDHSVSLLFAGADHPASVKKRYKDLIKIFHPDNTAGDTGMIQKINEEYEKLKKEYGIG